MLTDPPADLVAQLYEELHRRAARLVEHRAGSVAATSLVHEAFEKLYRADPGRWNDIVHFKATASRAMKQVLADRIKAKGRMKRWAGLERITLGGVGEEAPSIDLMAMHQALVLLERASPRKAEVLRMRVYGGMEVEEIGRVLSISTSTVGREWRAGRAFVLSALQR